MVINMPKKGRKKSERYWNSVRRTLRQNRNSSSGDGAVPLNKEEELTARTNNEQVCAEKIKGDRDSCLSSIDTDVLGTENVKYQKVKRSSQTNFKMFDSINTETANVTVHRKSDTAHLTLNKLQNDVIGNIDIQEQNMKTDKETDLNCLQEKTGSNENDHGRNYSPVTDTLCSNFQRAVIDTENDVELKMNVDKDSNVIEFEKARTPTEDVQVQKIQAGRDLHLNVFQNYESGIENVQDQKKKRDRDSHLKMITTFRKGIGENEDKNLCVNMSGNGAENVQEQNRMGHRALNLKKTQRLRATVRPVTDIPKLQKIKKCGKSTFNTFQKDISKSERKQDQKMEADRDSGLNIIQDDVADTENVHKHEHNMKGSKQSNTVGNVAQQIIKGPGKRSRSTSLKSVTTEAQNIQGQSANVKESKRAKIDTFSQYLLSLDKRRLAALSKSNIKHSNAYTHNTKSELDMNKRTGNGKLISSQKSHAVNAKRTVNLSGVERVKKCRLNKSEEQRSIDKLKDREWKKSRRLKRREEEVEIDKSKDADRKKSKRLKRRKEEVEIDKSKDADRKKSKRLKRRKEEVEIDKSKDADRKKSRRLKRRKEEVEIDKHKNAKRMKTFRLKRRKEEVEIDKSKDADRKKSKRLKRRKEEVEIDKSKDADRKKSRRLKRRKEEVEIDKDKNAKRMKTFRLNRRKEEVQIDKSKDADRKKSGRLKRRKEEVEIDKSKDADRKKLCRQIRTQEELEKDYGIDAERKRLDRVNRTPEELEIDRKEDMRRKRQERQLQVTIDSSINKFKEVIQEGPTFICSCCNRLLYRRCVYKYSLTDFKIEFQPLVEKCKTNKISFDNNEYICNTCRNSLRKGQLPAMAEANSMKLDEIPQQLKELTSLEVIFIARRIPFMKLLGLPRGKQKAIHGCVVNIPVEPEQSVSVLPRVPSPDTVIPVRLKRKIQYRGHVLMQNIRPQKIKEALNMLKHGLSNPLYDDVVVNEEWERSSREADSSLWDTLTREPDNTARDDVERNDEGSDDDGDDDEEGNREEEDENSKLRGLPYDSCLQPKSVTEDSNFVLNVAPGEGKRHEPFEKDQNSEELSFPHLFPSGKFGYSMQRPSKISMKKYFQSRVLNADGRFSKCIEYIFYAQYQTEAREIADSLSVALRKGKESDVTAGDLKNKVESLIRNDLGIHFLQNIRGSPAFFNKLLYDLLGMIRQLGPCTWFVTLSAADLKWPDTIRVIAAQQGETLTDQEIENMTWEQKCTWLRSNPVTAARHFDHRIDLFMKHVLLNQSINPLGEISDFKYRIEFQQRGSPHVHMLVWVKNAPDMESSSEEEIQQFVDKHVSCSVPEDKEDLRQLLQLVQRHTHSVACRKHGKACRFHFPRLPVRNTTAFKPMDEEVPAATQEVYKEILATIHEKLDNINQDNEICLDDILGAANIAEDQYMRALRWFKTKSGRPAIVLKRKPSEICINNYNEVIMMSWEANHDVQFVTSVLECVFYVASYMSKPEKTLGDLLKGVSKSGQHLGPKASMKAVAKKFLTHREVSAQEAVYRLLSLPLTKGSRQVVFIPTDLPENRTRLFKPMKVIETLEDDDQDVFQLSILDRYEARPNSLEDLCLAEFVARYSYSAKPRKSDTDPEDVSESDDEIDEQRENLPKKIRLLKDRGYMSLRRKHAVVRSHQFSQVKDPEKYYHAQLLLYCPWREEISDLLEDSYQNSYTKKQQIIEANRERFEHHVEEVNEAIDKLAENGPPDEGWGNLAPQTEQLRDEERREGAAPDGENVFQAFETTDETHAAKELGLIPHEYDLQPENFSNQEWYNMVISLNEKQLKVHDFITSWCTDMILTHRAERPPPFHIFLTGGAGVGKSHLVRTLVQTATRIFSRNNQTDHNHVLVCAPTGTAAYNIAGHTIHSAFLLPINESKYDDYVPLSNEKLTGLKEAIGDIKILVLDEISMVGTDLLLSIHRRLCDVMGNQDPFGGVSVLAVGDLLQLPPVGRFPIFDPPTDEMAALYGSLWKNHFEMIELTEIVRQKNDENFASLLNRVRIGKQTTEDIEILKQREISINSPDYPKLAPHIFAFNDDKDKHNTEILDTLPEPVYTFKARDSKRDSQTGRVKVTSFPKKAGGLLPELKVGIGARVTLTQNIDVSDGLVNCATGFVTGFIPPPPTQDIENWVPKYILVRFDDDRVGRKCRALNKGLLNDSISTPIAAVENQVKLGKYSKVTAKRKQFPLTLAWGGTIHKEQGKTEDRVVLSCKGSFKPGQFYTGISRTKTLEGLFILDKLEVKKITTSKKYMQEVNRMKEDAVFNPPIPLIVSADPELYLKVGFLNVNSLIAHSDSFKTDKTLLSCKIIALAETWLTPDREHPVLADYGCLRHDSKLQRIQRSGGLLMYIHHDFHIIRQVPVRDVDIETIVTILSPRWNPAVRICAIVVYKNPRMTARQFLPQLEKLLACAPIHSVPTVIMGDLNIDNLTQQNSSRDLKHLMSYYGFSQHVKKPTHRRGGLLDHLYYNRQSPLIQVDTKAVYYSDHLQICSAIPYPSFYENY